MLDLQENHPQETQDREIIFQNERARNVHERPLLNHNSNWDKRQVLTMSTLEKDTRQNVHMQSEGEPDLDKIAQRA